ncbi:MAG: hypothetical protein G01um101429_591 [Parcubacteria group bacterium Gr01-1014_29]|nr:MAG: hypothetical protein G01um101429_591 [Parcubacteria group bacterium Gr01-1014_29]
MFIKNTSKIDEWQKRRQRMFKSVPAKGKVTQYLGKKFVVYKNTFWPFMDSQPLVKNFKINSEISQRTMLWLNLNGIPV